jgi:hypothetical protein
LSGTGSITAHGGNTTNGNRGPGGGGRIAIYYGTGSGGFATNPLIAAAAKAYGGIDTTTAAKSAAAGTVFFKSTAETYGNLSIDNGNRVTTSTGARTVILSTSGTNLSSVSSTSITVGGAFSNLYSYNNFLEGLFINPRTTQNATSGLSDDTIFRISSNSASTLNLTAGDATTVAAANDPYRMVLRLDNLDVVGKATLSFPNHDIYVSDGDITSGNANFLLDGTVFARTLDIGSGTYSMSGNGVQSNLTNRCAGAVNTANGASLNCP